MEATQITTTSRKRESMFVNFSTPQRTKSKKSIQRLAPKRKQEDGEDDGQVRVVKAKFVQLHVTSDDFHLPPGTSNELQTPVIPPRTTSLHRKTSTWPTDRRAGTFQSEAPPLPAWTPWELERERPGSRWARIADRTRNSPPRAFVQLPREIYQCIVEHVQDVHTASDGVDVKGLQDDLRSLCLVDKKWHRIARDYLYQELWLPSNKAPKKRFFSRKRKPSRLRLLLDVFSKTPDLASAVRRMHIGTELASQLRRDMLSKTPRKGSALAILKELVLQSPSLEHLTGCALPAVPSTIPLLDALASRTQLRSHAWNLSSRDSILLSVGDFVYCHDAWTNLDTLVVATDPGVDLGQVSISAVLSRLPSLKHLMLSGLHSSDFNDRALMSLPALRSLRLEDMGGLTDQGIEQLAFSRLAISLRRLTLAGLGLVSLQTLQTLLAHLTRLKRFRFIQETSPGSQSSVGPTTGPQTLHSQSLEYLHWDCLVPGAAVSQLADAIENGRFPHLKKAKVPCDHEGAIQGLCRPIPRVRMTEQDLQYLKQHQGERDLRVAQIQAQLRVRESRQRPSVQVLIQDEMEVRKTGFIGSYLGRMESKIEYCLEPDVGSEHALCRFEDFAVARRGDGSRLEQCMDAAALF
ncbi:Hypothetical predicted protein [Lecanosticta acicola]|uniref:F-box domain-containing protein n=1 Tax=Lecanosticta acicola TaxID=111012 RepID=A0AAI8YSD1_9PEZI|nr:Hypothetical predicted protein [Lecanosticta acicola]